MNLVKGNISVKILSEYSSYVQKISYLCNSKSISYLEIWMNAKQ